MIDKIFREEFAEKVINSKNAVVVDFFADWCGPCKMLSPVLEELKMQNPNVDFYKVNIDDNIALADAYGISTIPNVVMFKNGEPVDRSVGYRTLEQMQMFIDKNK